MEELYWIPVAAVLSGAGLAILQTYLEKRRYRKSERTVEKNKEDCSKLEQTLANMGPDELKKKLKIVG